MSVSQYEMYLRIGRALKNSDKRMASAYAQAIIKSNRRNRKSGDIGSDKMSLSRHDKRICREEYSQ